MGSIYKIHPAIGVARVGDSPDQYFIGPETPGSPGILLINEYPGFMPVTNYKYLGKVRRQAARFRVFEYRDDNRTLVREITTKEAKIEWTVDLINRKAALRRNTRGHPAKPRNLSVSDLHRLVIRNPHASQVSGTSIGFGSAPQIKGTFLDKSVYLGELHTESEGRLMVLGGQGTSAFVPTSAAPSPDEHLDFANNDGWYDDLSDGPVKAEITFPGQQAVSTKPAWVIVGPPDFAPQIDSVVTLYDIAWQAAIDKGLKVADSKPSFKQHIEPIILRRAKLRWVRDIDDDSEWDSFLRQMEDLGKTDAANKDLRARLAGKLTDPNLSRFDMPQFVRTYIDQWVKGEFIPDLHGPDLQMSLPEQLDRAALEACVGSSMYPGIEASVDLKDKNIYAEPLRIDQSQMVQEPTQPAKRIYPGFLREIMAVPWQADFVECSGNGWWPSQRPGKIRTDFNNISKSEEWINPIAEATQMIENGMKLGYVAQKTRADVGSVFVESERDPSYRRTTNFIVAERDSPIEEEPPVA
jgi:L-Lysine epsilon oxidase N-terminal/L-lysine epsilon oxidase C-terminal domain